MTNIILLMSDEHNPFYSSVYGHSLIKTPHMARMAKEGTLYQNAYCPSPLCGPSRSSFMSGKRVHEIQTYSNSDINLNPNHLSYGKALSDQGIHVTHIGKTDVYDKAENLGFSEMLMPKDTHYPRNELGRKPLMTLPDGAQRADKYGPHSAPWDLDDSRIKTAVNWLSSNASNAAQPWVLIINLRKPHFPHYTTQELWDLYPTGGDLPEYGINEPTAQHPYAQDLRHFFSTEQFTTTQIRGLRRGYLGCVTYIDQQLGQILDTVQSLGLYNNTNIIYTSDHGEMLGKFGMWWKCSLYEDAVRVPCLAMGPDFQSNQIVDTPIDLLDIQATLFQSVGAKRPYSWTGHPLQKIPKNDPNRVVFSEYHGHGTRASAFMVRQGNWKLIYYIDGPNQLFNLEDDPNELINLAVIHSNKALELEKELRKICSPEVEQERAEIFIQRQLDVVNHENN